MSASTPENTDLDTRLEAAGRGHGGFVKVDDVKHVVEAVMESMQGELTRTDIQLYMELESLAGYIEQAKADIASLRPDEVRDSVIPSASDELDAIVEATAEATNKIMDCAEIVEAEMPNMPQESADKVMEATTNIFEACGFQDITGQRITKVVRALQDIEEKIGKLVEAFGAEIARVKQDQPTKTDDNKPQTDEDLLGGPQLKDAAKSQSEIDALLASFD